MGLSTVRPLFSQKWVDGLAPIAEAGMTAQIEIFDPQTSQAVYDVTTNTYTQDPLIAYSGKARVQPLRSASYIKADNNDAPVQAVQVQIPISSVLGVRFSPKHRLKVVSCPLNPALVGILGSLREAIDSSNPFERTLLFDVNQESYDG